MVLSNLLYGTHVRLTSLTKIDIPVVTEWYQNPEFMRLFDSGPAFPKTETTISQWLEDDDKSHHKFTFAVRLIENELLIGLVAIDEIEWNNQVGGLAIGLGGSAHWGKGYGFEASQLALAFAFNELNLRRIQLGVFSYNARAIALYEKLGFQREGVYREYILRDGQPFDMYLYGLLRHEWQAGRE